MKITGKRKKGVALAVTMLILSVMMLISVAFFQSYQSHFSITRSSRASETAALGCEAVFDYVTYRLEHDRDWGSSLFTPADQNKDPLSPLVELQSIVGSHDFSGRIPGTRTTFSGTIYNNFSGLAIAGGEDPALFPPDESASALCVVECKNGDAVRRVEFLVREAPLFDSAALTRANLKVDAQSLTLRSLDTNRNMLRSEKNIYVPDMLTGDGRTKFYLAGVDQPDTNGMLWAKGDIYSIDGAAENLLDEATEYATAASTSHGKMLDKASSHFSLQELDSDIIEIPDTHTTIPLVHPASPQPGNNMAGQFNFTRRLATVTVSASYYVADDDETETFNNVVVPEQIYVDVLEYYAPGTSPETGPPTKVFRGKERTEDIMATGFIPQTIDEDDGWFDDTDTGVLTDLVTTNVAVDIPGYSNGVQILEDNKLVFGDAAAANLTFDLETQDVTATQDALIDVNGPFKITSSDNGSPVDPPVLNLGFDDTVGDDGKLSKAIIRAEGSIEIKDGVTKGLGGLISKSGDVVIQPKDTPEVLVDGAASGMMVFAGGDVSLANPDNATNWIFRGLVYARGGITMDGNSAANAKFEGSLVALSENDPDGFGINLTECNNIEFVYSKQMLEQNVANLKGDRTQVEVVYWRD